MVRDLVGDTLSGEAKMTEQIDRRCRFTKLILAKNKPVRPDVFIPALTAAGLDGKAPQALAKDIGLIGFILLIALATVVGLQYSDTETALERAYRECGLCGSDRAEVDRQIENKRRSRLTRDEEIELYYSTGKRLDLEPCLPCVEAVLDAAGKEKENTP